MYLWRGWAPFIGANVELHAGGSGATMEKTEGKWEAEDVIFQEL